MKNITESYRCEKCGVVFTIHHAYKFLRWKPLLYCPKCGTHSVKIVSD